MIMNPVFTYMDALGYLAAGIVFLTFCMRTMTSLRLTAIASNVAFISYSIAAQLTPILVLHSALLALNLTQLFRIRRQLSRSETAALKAASGDFSDGFAWLLPMTRKRRFERGERLFAKGDPSEALFVIRQGRVMLPELGITLGPGEILGEISLFSADRTRTATALAAEDIEVGEMSEREVHQLCQDHPAFAYNLTQIITRRLVSNLRNAPPSLRMRDAG